MSENILFFSENIQFVLKDKIQIRNWIREVIHESDYRAGKISFIFCDDLYLSEINVKYLKHKSLTDIITFSYHQGTNLISGDIYISIPRVTENAVKFKQAFWDELHRVIIHGVLHLMGHEDSTKLLREEMRKREDRYLSQLESIVV